MMMINCNGDCADCTDYNFCIIHKSELSVEIETLQATIQALGRDYSFLYAQIVGVQNGTINVEPEYYADDLIDYWTLERANIKARLDKLEKELKKLKELEQISNGGRNDD